MSNRVLTRFLAVFLLLAPGVALPSLAAAQAAPAVRAEPVAESASAPVDVVADAWADEEVAPEPEPEPGPQLEAAWFGSDPAWAKRVHAVRLAALQLGAGDAWAPAQALIAKPDPVSPALHAELGLALAPDIPAIRHAAGRAYLAEGNYARAVRMFVSSIIALPAHPESLLWLIGSLLSVAGIVMVLASLAFIAVVGVSRFGDVAHDFADLLSRRAPYFARVALLGAIVVAPLLFGEGLVGLALALFAVGFAYVGKQHRVALSLAVGLLILGLFPMGRMIQAASSAMDVDPSISAALAVMRGVETRADLEHLMTSEGDEILSLHALAHHERMRGNAEGAKARYEQLLEIAPDDGVALANLGNMAFRAGETEKAIELYERASETTESPILWFNLSQAYAKVFRMDEYETAIRNAQAIGDGEVDELSKVGDSEMVADLPFPEKLVWSRLLGAAETAGELHWAIQWIAPGHLGRSWLHMAGAFGAIAILGLLFLDRFDHATSCKRCGGRICARCDETTWNEETCESCYRLFQRPEGTDPIMRMARLQSLAARESRLNMLATVTAVCFPGAAGLLARRPDLGILGMLLFGFFVAWLVWPSGLLPDPYLVVGGTANLVLGVVGVTSLILYLGIVASGVIARRSL